MAKANLAEQFITELLTLSLKSTLVYTVCAEHLEYTYLPTEPYKKLWQYIRSFYATEGRLPSIGALSQAFVHKPEILELIAAIKTTPIPNKDDTLRTLEEFIKQNRFVAFYEDLGAQYNKGNKEQAYAEMTAFVDSFKNFSLSQGTYQKVFAEFGDRYVDRVTANLIESNQPERVDPIFGIDELDKSVGIIKRGDAALILAQSGVGKSTILRWIGIANARRGLRGVHFQLEDTMEHCLLTYDAAWSSQTILSLDNASLEIEEFTKIDKKAREFQGEVFVYAYEQFEEVTMANLESKLVEIIRKEGAIDFWIVDYLELATVGKKFGAEHERMRRLAIATAFKRICVKHNIAGFIATQGSSIPKQVLNDPKFVQTRFNIGEAKALINPFTLFITLNQTDEEYEQGIARIWVDKARKSARNQLIKIAQRLDIGRFYDRARTQELYGTV